MESVVNVLVAQDRVDPIVVRITTTLYDIDECVHTFVIWNSKYIFNCPQIKSRRV